MIIVVYQNISIINLTTVSGSKYIRKYICSTEHTNIFILSILRDTYNINNTFET